jgi:hypothetical protein
LPSKAELEPTLQSIKKTVENGEFDRLLEKQLAYGIHLKKIGFHFRLFLTNPELNIIFPLGVAPYQGELFKHSYTEV